LIGDGKAPLVIRRLPSARPDLQALLGIDAVHMFVQWRVPAGVRAERPALSDPMSVLLALTLH